VVGDIDLSFGRRAGPLACVCALPSKARSVEQYLKYYVSMISTGHLNSSMCTQKTVST
jgi:hypothetical protein